MLEKSLISQCLFLLAAFVISARITIRSRSVLKGGLCLYGLFVCWAVLFGVVIPGLLLALKVDSHEVVRAFPEAIGVLPVILTSWIQAFIFGGLVRLLHRGWSTRIKSNTVTGSEDS